MEKVHSDTYSMFVMIDKQTLSEIKLLTSAILEDQFSLTLIPFI